MRHQHAVPRRAFVLAAMVLPLLLAGCSKKPEMPGVLTKSIDDYTGEEFYELTHHLKYGGGSEHERKCKGDTACAGAKPAKKTKVRVDAVDGQGAEVNPASVPPYGIISIRAINKGDEEEARYGMPAGQHLEYYLIVLPGTATEGKWRLEQLDTKAKRHTKIADGIFQGCGHPGASKEPVVRASFNTCASAHSSDSLQKSGLMLQDPLDAPMWIYCSDGCCIAAS